MRARLVENVVGQCVKFDMKPQLLLDLVDQADAAIVDAVAHQ